MKTLRALAFVVLAVSPPVVLAACGGLFGAKDTDAGVDAAAVVVVDAEAVIVPVEAPSSAPLESAGAATDAKPTAPGVRRDPGAADAGGLPSDAGKAADSGIPTPTPKPFPSAFPSGFKVPALPSGMKVPAGFPSQLIPR